jgi:hypothetical protein
MKPLSSPRWLAFFVCLLFARSAGAAPLAKELTLGHGAGSLMLTPDGALLDWGRLEGQTTALSGGAGQVHYAGHLFQLANPRAVSRDRDGLSFTYAWPEQPGLEVTIQHHLNRERQAWSWTREVQVKGPRALSSDLEISIGSGLRALPPQTWLPLMNGVGASLDTNQAAAYRLAGALPETGAALALPMVSVPLDADRKRTRRLMIAADPYFSVLFTSTALAWTYPAAVGLENGCEKRTLVMSSHDGSADESLDCFFRILLPDVSPGPAWLHDIAMVDYDYMSDGGRGWFHDIDALAASLPKADRRKVLFCLHGWYDFLGRYCFDVKTGKFDQQWTVFSNYEAAQKVGWGTIGGDRVPVGFANCKPLKMSLKEVHERLQYALSRGFRVGMYFADGMNAGDGLPDYDPACVLEWGGWQGADVKGKSYVQNPLHPKVRAFYLAYAKAQLAEFGPDLDMINWDETFHVPVGKWGTKAAPGYADRAVMRLAHDITRLFEDYNRTHGRQIAFLTSDCLGAVYGVQDKAPYALMAHGTYQDSWCQPHAWSYGIFPNYRNVLWSVCWWPITKWNWIEFGVRNYQAAVSLSNGWGDDIGFFEMTPAQQSRALELFNWRKTQRTHLKWFAQLPPEPDKPK